MRMRLLGTGTSHGIPAIACSCAVCRSKDRHDKRLRCSAYVTNRNRDGTETHVLVDIGPEFRIQALRYRITAVDTLLLTHSHSDHLYGLDDIRVFSHTDSEGGRENSPEHSATPGRGLTVYANADTVQDILVRFDYIFRRTQIGGGKPKLDLEDCARFTEETPLEAGDLRILPIPMRHGTVNTTGWLFSCAGKDGKRHSAAYLTDCNEISAESTALLARAGGIIDHVVIDGLRETPHPTHFSYLEAAACAEKIGGTHTWLTHICHTMSHEEIRAYLKSNLSRFPALERIVAAGGSVEPAYDGLLLKSGE